MKVIVLVLAALGLVVAPVSVTHAQTLNVAVLTPCCGNPEPNGTGLVQAQVLVKPDVLQVDLFSGSVTIPIPSAGLGISKASTADIRLVLDRAGAPYAECFLARTHDDDDDDINSSDDDNGTATFLVSIAKAKARSVTLFKQFVGSCDIDVAADGIQPGIPPVQSGDVVTASSVVGSVSTPFLQGSFVQQ